MSERLHPLTRLALVISLTGQAAVALDPPRPVSASGFPESTRQTENCTVPSFVIVGSEGEEGFTHSKDVTLRRICLPGATEMMFSNDGGFGGAKWEPYAPEKSWELRLYKPGQLALEYRVYAQGRNAQEEIVAYAVAVVHYSPWTTYLPVIAR